MHEANDPLALGQCKCSSECGSDSIAQLVEQYTFNVWVLGSNPSGITRVRRINARRLLSSVGSEHLVYTEGVIGSSPIGATICPSGGMVDTLVLGTSAAGVKVRILSRVHEFNESNFGVYKPRPYQEKW